MHDDILIPTYTKLPYRRGVGMMIVNKNKQVFVGKRIDTRTDTWQMPQGGINEDETIREAALRELQEETNITSVNIISESGRWFYYDVPEFLVDKLWDGKYRGQKQKWLLFKFLGQEDEINVNIHVPEFEKWKWVDLRDLPKLIVDFKKQLYTSIIDEFALQISALKF
jgi:putative (di)nucleoside polyphosphate hydrolase